MSLFVCFFCYRSGDGPGWHVGIGHEIEAAQAQNILANPVVNSTVGQIESGRTFEKYLQCAERFFWGGFQQSEAVCEMNPSIPGSRVWLSVERIQ